MYLITFSLLVRCCSYCIFLIFLSSFSSNLNNIFTIVTICNTILYIKVSVYLEIKVIIQG